MKYRTNPKQPISKTTLMLFGQSKFTGFMQFSLAGAETPENFHATSIFEGDFAYERTRHTIFSVPRYYKFTVYLRNHGGYLIDEADYFPDEPLSHAELTQTIKQMCHEQIMEANPNVVDLYNSHVRISVYNRNKKEHLL